MGTRGSLTYQFQRAMRSLVATGESKHEDRRAGVDTQQKNYSIATQLNYSQIQGRFAEYAKTEFGIRWAKELNETHGTAYLAQLEAKGCSASYLKQCKAALIKLEIGIRTTYGVEVRLVRADWVSPRRSLETRAENHGPYSLTEANQIIDRLERRCKTPQVILGAKIQLDCNARVGELLGNKAGVGGIRVRQIDFERGVIHLEGKDTKGGRVRDVVMSERVAAGLRARIEEADLKPNDRVFSIPYQRYERPIRYACQKLGIQSKGDHGFRGTWAAERIEAIERKYSNPKSEADFKARRAEKLEVSRGMGHGRLDVLASYEYGR